MDVRRPGSCSHPVRTSCRPFRHDALPPVGAAAGPPRATAESRADADVSGKPSAMTWNNRSGSSKPARRTSSRSRSSIPGGLGRQDRARCARDSDLAAVGGLTHAAASVNRDTDVGALEHAGLAGVQADPDAKHLRGRRTGGQFALRVHGTDHARPASGAALIPQRPRTRKSRCRAAAIGRRASV